MDKPLSGIKVIELARVLAGPWIGQSLADLGAEVIKVESPNGDETRTWGPPFLEVGEGEISAYFLSCNRGKSSVVVDFTDPEQNAALKELISTADVLIENFKVGGLKKYGLDYESLSKEFPKLIYCSVTGFGQDGPYAQRAGYDFLIQGMSGMMDITGEPNQPPQKIGVALSDIITGLYGVIGIQAALWERNQSGLGQHIDMSLMDCMTSVLANQGLNYLATGKAPKRMGNQHPNIFPYSTFAVQDGYIIIAIGNDGQFVRFLEAIELTEFIGDPRFQSNALRLQNRRVLGEYLEAKTRTFARDTLLRILYDHTVPAAPINTIEDVFNDPHTQARGMEISIDGVPSIRNPIVFSRSNIASEIPPPRLGKTITAPKKRR